MAKPDAKLSDMPPHIKQSIVNDSDTGTKLSLRGINKQFKEVVERSAINYKRLTLSLNCNKIELVWQKTQLENVKQVFMPTEKGFVMISDTFPVKYGEGDYRKAAVAKMLSVFKNSKVTVGELLLEVSQRGRNVPYELRKFNADRVVIFAEIRRILSPKNFRPKVAKLKIRLKVSERMLFSVLQYLEPGILKVLDIKCRMPTSRCFIEKPTFTDQITDTDQWRQLKEVDIGAYKLDAPFEKFSHLEKLSLSFSRRRTMRTILEIVLQNPTMKKCSVGYRVGGFDMTGAEEYLDQFEKIPERSRYWQTCIKHPYEEGKRVEIGMNFLSLEIKKYDD